MAENESNRPLWLTVNQAARLLGIGRTKLYDLINHEELPIIRLGRLVRIDPASLREWMSKREKKGA